MATWVKICGITRLEDAQRAIELGAAALGFNFYRPSPRYIEPAEARRIISELPSSIEAVGVFANQTDGGHIASIARQAGVRTVQLHGPDLMIQTGALESFRTIRAVAIRQGTIGLNLEGIRASAILLDTFDPDLHGGTGKTFDWNVAREAKRYGPIILAGGLNPDNVTGAIREVAPYGVDVASGVESSPGVKDSAKLRVFFAAVKEADSDPNL